MIAISPNQVVMISLPFIMDELSEFLTTLSKQANIYIFKANFLNFVSLLPAPAKQIDYYQSIPFVFLLFSCSHPLPPYLILSNLSQFYYQIVIYNFSFIVHSFIL